MRIQMVFQSANSFDKHRLLEDADANDFTF